MAGNNVNNCAPPKVASLRCFHQYKTEDVSFFSNERSGVVEELLPPFDWAAGQVQRMSNKFFPFDRRVFLTGDLHEDVSLGNTNGFLGGTRCA